MDTLSQEWQKNWGSAGVIIKEKRVTKAYMAGCSAGVERNELGVRGFRETAEEGQEWRRIVMEVLWYHFR